MRVLVCGGRDFGDLIFVWNTLDTIHAKREFSALIHGGARGADSHAKAWARYRGIFRLKFLPDYKRYSKEVAPFMRNQRMLVEGKPDLVVAFAGGNGTADMVKRSRSAGIDVVEPRR